MRCILLRMLAMIGALAILTALSCPAGAQTKEAGRDLRELQAVVEPIPDEFRKGGLSRGKILETITEVAERNGITVHAGSGNPEADNNGGRLIVQVAGSCDHTRLCYLDLTLSLKTPKEITRTSAIGEPVVRSNTQRILSLIQEMFERLLAQESAT